LRPENLNVRFLRPENSDIVLTMTIISDTHDCYTLNTTTRPLHWSRDNSFSATYKSCNCWSKHSLRGSHFNKAFDSDNYFTRPLLQSATITYQLLSTAKWQGLLHWPVAEPGCPPCEWITWRPSALITHTHCWLSHIPSHDTRQSNHWLVVSCGASSRRHQESHFMQ